MQTSCIFICAGILCISLILPSIPLANAVTDISSAKATYRNTPSTPGNNKRSKTKVKKRSRKVGEDLITKLFQETARYAFNFDPVEGLVRNSTNSGSMASPGITDMISQIRDPFKQAVTSAVISGLYIAALISLIVFATTGTVAFICSFSDCKNFFLGMKSDGGSPRPYTGGPFLFRRRENGQYRWDHMQPVVQSLHDSYDKFEHKLLKE